MGFTFRKSKTDFKGGGDIVQRIFLRLPSCGPGFVARLYILLYSQALNNIFYAVLS